MILFFFEKKMNMQVALKVLYLNADLKNATDARRIHNQLVPEQTVLENEFSQV
jgi:gamma-glutamyltranspeptidase